MHFILMGDLKLIPLNQNLRRFKVLWLPIFFRFFFFLFSHFEKVEYKSVWLAPLVKAPRRIGGIDWAIFFSTEFLIIKCGNYTDLFSSMIHLFHSLRNNKKWVFVPVLAEKEKYWREHLALPGCPIVQDSGKSPNFSYLIFG